MVLNLFISQFVAEQKQNSSSPLATSPVKSKSDSNNGSPEKMSNDNVDMIESQNANNIKNSENLNQAKGKFIFEDLLWRLKLKLYCCKFCPILKIFKDSERNSRIERTH